MLGLQTQYPTQVFNINIIYKQIKCVYCLFMYKKTLFLTNLLFLQNFNFIIIARLSQGKKGKHNLKSLLTQISNRPGIAGDVLQSPSSLINSLINSLLDPLVQISSKHCQSQTGRARELKFFKRMFIPHLASHVSCQLSRVTCHMSPATCHLSPVTCQKISQLQKKFTKWWSQLVKGLLSTGPTPSSLSGVFSFSSNPPTGPIRSSSPDVRVCVCTFSCGIF